MSEYEDEYKDSAERARETQEKMGALLEEHLKIEREKLEALKKQTELGGFLTVARTPTPEEVEKRRREARWSLKAHLAAHAFKARDVGAYQCLQSAEEFCRAIEAEAVKDGIDNPWGGVYPGAVMIP